MRIIALLLFLPSFFYGQNFKALFDSAFAAEDTAQQRHIIREWQVMGEHEPLSAAFYVSAFTYYFNLGRQEMLSLQSEPDRNTQMEIRDSLGNISGYMSSTVRYDRSVVNEGLEQIRKGIERYPNRLDLRYGEIYVLGELEEFEAFTLRLIEAIDYSAAIENEWLWAENEPVEEPENFFLGNIQDYQLTLYDTERDSLLSNMRRIANAVLVHYPNHIISLSNIALTHMVKRDWNQTIEFLEKAYAIDPQDSIVISNLAHCYEALGEMEMVRRYYRILSEHDDPELAAFGAQMLLDLD